MYQLSITTAWNSAHPLLAHFALALFFSVPMALFLAALTKSETRRLFLISALLMLLVAHISGYGAFEAGENVAIAMDPTGDTRMGIEGHRKFADLARNSLIVATFLFALTLLLCKLLHLRVYELTGVLPLGSATFYALGLFWLIHAAHQGEGILHQTGAGNAVGP